MVKRLSKTEQLDLLCRLDKDSGICLQDSIEGAMSVITRAQKKRIKKTQTENSSTRKETPITHEEIPTGEDTDNSGGDTKDSGKDSGNVKNSGGDMDNSDAGNSKVTSGH